MRVTSVMTRVGLTKRVAVCVVLGLVTSWLVAWGFAIAGPPTSYVNSKTIQQGKLNSTTEMSMSISTSTGRVCKYYRFSQAIVSPLPPPRTYHKFPPEIKRTGWGLREDYFAQSTGRKLQLFTETAYGWPAPSLWYADFGGRWPTPRQIVGGIPLSGFGHSYAGIKVTSAALPYVPIWRGLLINTAFFAAVWAIPLSLIPVARARRRIRRGLCPDCCYDLCGATDGGCPECGWGRMAVGSSPPLTDRDGKEIHEEGI